ncbi:MAG: phage portal protein [Oscillospiraceae bacterium]|nr:phage portal protein [Oscillospiraceae bacterium]
MGLIKKRATQEPAGTHSVQTSRDTKNPFCVLDTYSPLKDSQTQLYTALREAVPIIDAAIFKLVRLIGGFKITLDDQNAQEEIAYFLETVQVNGTSYGIHSFISSYFEQLLTFGTAVGEIVTANAQVAALYNAELSCIELQRGDTPLDIKICNTASGTPVPVKYPNLILISLLNPTAGRICGNSLLKGLPFISSVLIKIYNTIGINWDRLGNVRFAVTYKPSNESVDKTFAKQRAMQMAKEWGEAMHGDGVRDFVAVGDVQIKAIGADNQILDSEVPVRQILEQIVAKTGLPPFMLGLTWSSTERMSSQQADVLTSELEAYRRLLNPVIFRICDTFLRLKGCDAKFKIEWDDITLQDEVELSKAKLYNAQADKINAELNILLNGSQI